MGVVVIICLVAIVVLFNRIREASKNDDLVSVRNSWILIGVLVIIMLIAPTVW